MKKLLNVITLLILVILGVACNGGEEESTSIPEGASDAPGIWSNSRLPLNIKWSEDFSANERSGLAGMAQQWEDLLSGEKDFFTVDADNTTPNKQFSNTNSYNDGVLGVYKNTNWPSQFGSSTLAVTQSFGYYNQDSRGVYIQMVHADIIFNYDFYSFSLFPSFGQYDLESVALHELGHFIGMKHDDIFENSVMIPRISSGSIKRFPTSRDEEVLRNNYRLSGSGSSSSLLASISALKIGGSEDTEQETFNIDPRVGKDVKVVIELKAHGDCEHYVDGELVHSHKVDMRKLRH